MVNFTNEPLVYKHVVFAISDSSEANEHVESLYCQDLELNKYEYKLNKEQLDKEPAHNVRKSKEFRAEYKAGPPVELEPKAADDKGRYKFGVHYSTEASWPNGLDWFRFSEVTTQAELIISVDEQLKDHHFNVIPAPPNTPDGMFPIFDYASREYRCRWEYARLFVPNEVLIIRWQPPEAMAPSTEAIAPSTETIPHVHHEEVHVNASRAVNTV